MLIRQKVYDSTAGYVYYEKDHLDATPGSGETTPNHTDNLVGGTHQVVSTRENPGVEKYSASLQTLDDTPAILWSDPTAAARPVTLQAIVGAQETGLSRSDHRHFLIQATNFVSTEASWSIVSTEVSAAGTGGSAGWTAAFILTSDIVELQVVGDAGDPVNWMAEVTVKLV